LDILNIYIWTKDMQTEQLLCWSGMTDTEYFTTSGLNEEEFLGNHSELEKTESTTECF